MLAASPVTIQHTSQAQESGFDPNTTNSSQPAPNAGTLCSVIGDFFRNIPEEGYSKREVRHKLDMILNEKIGGDKPGATKIASTIGPVSPDSNARLKTFLNSQSGIETVRETVTSALGEQNVEEVEETLEEREKREEKEARERLKRL